MIFYAGAALWNAVWPSMALSGTGATLNCSAKPHEVNVIIGQMDLTTSFRITQTYLDSPNLLQLHSILFRFTQSRLDPFRFALSHSDPQSFASSQIDHIQIL